MTGQRDRGLIFASAGVRAAAGGLSGVMLALHLATLGLDAAAIGLAVSLGLGGCAIGTGVAAYAADRIGRRTSLVLLAGLVGPGGLLLAWTAHPSIVMMSMLIGMVNGMGRDRGAGLTVEQSILPHTTTSTERTRVFAWYNVTIDAGHAVGSLLG